MQKSLMLVKILINTDITSSTGAQVVQEKNVP